ncbi:DNA repair exonuclease SbcCD nuclease subunit [Paenibacillus sp. DS2015]|uniref:RNA polymerase subunit sigma-24 n=1 Tax=Paenibacillus sp. DS2015 TaxID=3373917 RepID=UPI003D1E1C9A
MTITSNLSTVEQRVIDQLTGYKDLVGRIRVLQTYSVGNEITVSRLNEDDQLQELHRKLRTMPTYMYLNRHEQKLEKTVSAYLVRYPAGTRSQKQVVQECNTLDKEDEKALHEVVQKIEKVIEARTGRRDGIEEVLERVAEFQDLQAEMKRIDDVLEVLEENRPQLSLLLRLHYLEDKPWDEVVKMMGISKSVFYRWRPLAVEKYSLLARGNK